MDAAADLRPAWHSRGLQARRNSGSRAARRDNGTRCSRFAFMRVCEIVQTKPSRSSSPHVASRTWPYRAAVNTRNSNGSLPAGCADLDARTVSTAAATSLLGQRPHVPHDVVLGTQDRHDPVARIVVS